MEYETCYNDNEKNRKVEWHNTDDKKRETCCKYSKKAYDNIGSCWGPGRKLDNSKCFKGWTAIKKDGTLCGGDNWIPQCRNDSDYSKAPSDLYNCCADNRDKSKCPPGYCKNSKSCVNLMKKACGAGYKIKDKSECKNFFKWWNAPEKDEIMNYICKYHKNDPICACYKNYEEIKKNLGDVQIPGPIRCLFPACKDDINSIKPYNFKSTDCKVINQVCNIEKIESTISDQGTLGKQDIQNNCSIDVGGPTGPIITGPTDPTDPTPPTDPTLPTDPTDPIDPTDPTDPTFPTGEESFLEQYWVYLIGGGGSVSISICCCCFLIIIIVIFFAFK